MTIRRYTSSSGQVGWQIDFRRVFFGTKTQAALLESRITREIDRLWAIEDLTAHKGLNAITLSELADLYYKYADDAHQNPGDARGRLKPILEYFGGEIPAASITPDDLVGYRSFRSRQKTRGGKYISPSTIDREHSALKAAYNRAVFNQLLDPSINPANYVKLARVPNFREIELTDPCMDWILSNCADDFHVKVFIFARYTGLRISHLLTLDWSQVDKARGLILPPKFTLGKSLYASSKRFGIVPLPSGLLDILGRYKASGPVFEYVRKRPNRGDTVKPVKSIHGAVLGVRKRAGLEFWLHDFRRTYATHLRRLGVDGSIRQVILGHAADPRYAVHNRYQAVTLADIQAVGLQLSQDQTYQDTLSFYPSYCQCANCNRNFLEKSGV